MKTALTIAGSDASGGAGIQADIKTMTVNGVYAMSAITALTAQNTTGVSAILEVTPHFLAAQLDAIFSDIPPDAVKIGMVASPELIQVIAEKLTAYKAKNIVLDPVMLTTSGSRLITNESIEILKHTLFPLASLITPNIPEAQVLTGITIKNNSQMHYAAKALFETFSCPVLLKGGHCPDNADDLLYTKDGAMWFYSQRIENSNNHGTGCTLSSAIATHLAKGSSLPESIQKAKEYIKGALGYGLNLGQGSGPINHAFFIPDFQ